MARRSTLAFLQTETGAGLLLVAAALLAVAWANSPWASGYAALTGQVVPVRVGPFFAQMTVADWVKNALMPIFFFVVGLEIKHEVLKGELANPRRLALPVLAAVGGVVVPALIYLGFNAGPTGRPEGWPTPAATDIAFALTALSLAGRGVPPTLRTFLLTLAIVDDVASVILIGVLFTHDLQPAMLAGAAATLAVLAGMSRWRQAPYAFWTAGALLLWGFVLKSGVNTSIAGVALALFIPLEPKRAGGEGVLTEVMDALHPYVAYFILPLFALTAAGFAFRGDLAERVLGPISLGVAAGLFIGKQVGVFGAALLAIGLKWARRPTGAKWLELYGVSALCGVGFTMALYLGGLAFPGEDLVAQTEVKAGVVLGSLLSALWGLVVLRYSNARRAPAD
jgi:NhaA family Na+:H+ antiporter